MVAHIGETQPAGNANGSRGGAQQNRLRDAVGLAAFQGVTGAERVGIGPEHIGVVADAVTNSEIERLDLFHRLIRNTLQL